MIKKIVNCVFRLVLVVLFLIPNFLEPFAIMNVKAASKATTIAGLKQELEKLKQQKQEAENSKKQTQAEINRKKNDVNNALNQQKQIAIDVEEAENKIVKSNKDIETATSDVNTLLKYYQLTSGDNVYFEYITGAKTPTDLIMRVDAISRISEYYKNRIDNLNDLIKENEQLKIDLAEKNAQLDIAIENTSKAIDGLKSDLASINEINEDIDSQISNQQALIKYYQSICTSDTQLLSDCVKVATTNGWSKPLVKGKVTSLWGYRASILGTSTFHNGTDIGGNAEGTNIYATANGTVAAITNGKATWQKTGQKTCGGIMVYIHVNVLGKPYTVQYAHLLDYKVKVGQTVNVNSIIGTVGGGAQEQKWDRCSTGAHLHYAVSTGYYLGGGSDGYSSWSKFVSKSIKTPGIPQTKGATWYSR